MLKKYIKLVKLVNMSIDFIKFNNMAFLLNYFFLLYKEEINEEKSHVQLEKQRQLTKPINRANLSYSSKLASHINPVE
jgi:hypothetical protein